MKKLIVLLVLLLAIVACGTPVSLFGEDALTDSGFIRMDSLEDSDCNGTTCRYYGEDNMGMLAMLKDGGIGLSFEITSESEAYNAGLLVGKVLYAMYPDAIPNWIAEEMDDYSSWANVGEVNTMIHSNYVAISVNGDYVTIVVIP